MPSLERIGDYEIIREIGRGGMGRVLLARDTVLGRTVAIKLISKADAPELAERFRQEARTLAILSHPAIVSIYQLGTTEEFTYIVMEYVNGHTLETLFKTQPHGEWKTYVPALAQCAEALDFAHRRGVVHRDVKPANIMIDAEGGGRILDFGIARMLASDASVRQTREGDLIGTVRYMAPEQLTSASVGPAADQFALALIVYTAVAGQYPFEAPDVGGVMYGILSGELRAPSAVNPGLNRAVDRVLMKALSKAPAERYASCAEFMTEFRAALEGPSAVQALPVQAPAPARLAPGGFWKTLKDLVLPATRTAHTGARRPTSVPPEPAIPAPYTRPPLPGKGFHIEETVLSSEPTPTRAPEVPVGPPPAPAGEFTQMFHAAPQTLILKRPPELRLDPETQARAQARELIELIRARDFEGAVALRGKWLPGVGGASGELLGFSEAARYLGAAQDAVSPYVRIEHLKRAEGALVSVGSQLLTSTSPLARFLPETLEVWKTYSRELLEAATHKASTELPNPFRAAQPLRPDQGQSVFRGRHELIGSIEAILADSRQSSSLALLGPRRCGKTSLLQMLPAMLPDCVCVFFDLQDNPVSTVSEFFQALVRRAREQARSQRRIELPELESEGTFEAATRWFESLDEIAEARRFLISIDEFERLKDLFPGDQRDLLRLMGLFRATIQHRRKIRLLVSGVAPFEELGPLWNDHFINVRELRIGHLDQSTSVDLLCHPIPEFPAGAVPEEVGKTIYQRTGGQPYLLQLYGTLLINRLNAMERSTAETDDVRFVEEEALTQGRYYFENTYKDAPERVRNILEALATGGEADVSGRTRRWLERRCLIDAAGVLRIPVLGVFINEELRA